MGQTVKRVERKPFKEIEPGLIQVFKLLLGIRLAFAVLGLCAWISDPNERLLRFPFIAFAETTFLLFYLSWPALQRSMGRYYLPIAVLIATVGATMGFMVPQFVRIAYGGPASQIGDDLWQLIFALLVPLLVVSWQYSFKSVVAFSLGSGLYIVFLTLPFQAFLNGPRTTEAFQTVIFIVILYLAVGYIVSRLMKAQRRQRTELAEANVQLAQHATTLQQLTISHERNRLARDLHDTLAHSLSAVAVQLEAVKSLWDEDPEEAQKILVQSLATTRSGLKETRLAIQDLRASPLEDLGLGLALQQIAKTTASRAGLRLELDVPEQITGLSESIEQGLYRVADEALTNIEHHADATHISMRYQEKKQQITLTIADDGRGFDTEAAPPMGHFGLKGMAERVSMMRGTLTVDSKPGHGTCIEVKVKRS